MFSTHKRDVSVLHLFVIWIFHLSKQSAWAHCITWAILFRISFIFPVYFYHIGTEAKLKCRTSLLIQIYWHLLVYRPIVSFKKHIDKKGYNVICFVKQHNYWMHIKLKSFFILMLHAVVGLFSSFLFSFFFNPWVLHTYFLVRWRNPRAVT